MSSLGAFIRSKRKLACFSLKNLGEAVGVSDSELMKIENGQRKSPNWETLCKLAHVLGFHPFEILLVSGYISEDDINPSLKIRGMDLLMKEDVETVQLFVDFMVASQSKRSSLRGKPNEL